MTTRMSAPMSAPMSPGAWGMLALLSVIWGGSFLLMAIAAPHLPPMTVVLCRVAIAAPVLVAAAVLAGETARPTRDRLWAWIGMGLLNNAVPITLIVAAQSFIPSGLSAIVQAATPLFTVLVAHAALADERATPVKVAGVAVGFAGVAVLSGAGFGATRSELIGVGLMLGACALYAGANVFGRRFRPLGIPPLAGAAGQVVAATLLLLPAVLVFDRPWTLAAPPAAVLPALLALGLVCTALAYALYFRILAEAGATNVALVTLLVPVSAVLFGAAVLGEVLEPRHLAGMALIAAALALIDGRLFARRPVGG